MSGPVAQPRDPGDAWVTLPDGSEAWGRFGAAGLLAVDRERGVLLQHRVAWSHHGGTWGIPGGALHQGEAAEVGAIRESQEEAGVPDGALLPRFTHLLDRETWTYTTVVADVLVPFEPSITDPESLELKWVPLDEVESYPLHPGFAASWPLLRDSLSTRPILVVDAANVVGSVPDGWWRDRRGAGERLRDRLSALSREGILAPELGLPGHRWHPEIALVTEGTGRGIVSASPLEDTAGLVEFHDDHDFPGIYGADGLGGVTLIEAPGHGDDTIAAVTARLIETGRQVFTVTSDRELAQRALSAGAQVRGSGWLRALTD